MVHKFSFSLFLYQYRQTQNRISHFKIDVLEVREKSNSALKIKMLDEDYKELIIWQSLGSEDTEKEKYGKYCSSCWHVFQKHIKQDINKRLCNNSQQSPLLLLTSSTGITMIKRSSWMSLWALNMEGKCSGGVKVKWNNTTDKYNKRKTKLSFQR